MREGEEKVSRDAKFIINGIIQIIGICLFVYIGKEGWQSNDILDNIAGIVFFGYAFYVGINLDKKLK